MLHNPVMILLQNFKNESEQFKNLSQRDFFNKVTFDVAAIDFESKQRKKILITNRYLLTRTTIIFSQI